MKTYISVMAMIFFCISLHGMNEYHKTVNKKPKISIFQYYPQARKLSNHVTVSDEKNFEFNLYSFDKVFYPQSSVLSLTQYNNLDSEHDVPLLRDQGLTFFENYQTTQNLNDFDKAFGALLQGTIHQDPWCYELFARLIQNGYPQDYEKSIHKNGISWYLQQASLPRSYINRFSKKQQLLTYTPNPITTLYNAEKDSFEPVYYGQGTWQFTSITSQKKLSSSLIPKTLLLQQGEKIDPQPPCETKDIIPIEQTLEKTESSVSQTVQLNKKPPLPKKNNLLQARTSRKQAESGNPHALFTQIFLASDFPKKIDWIHKLIDQHPTHELTHKAVDMLKKTFDKNSLCEIPLLEARICIQTHNYTQAKKLLLQALNNAPKQQKNSIKQSVTLYCRQLYEQQQSLDDIALLLSTHGIYDIPTNFSFITQPVHERHKNVSHAIGIYNHPHFKKLLSSNDLTTKYLAALWVQNNTEKLALSNKNKALNDSYFIELAQAHFLPAKIQLLDILPQQQKVDTLISLISTLNELDTDFFIHFPECKELLKSHIRILKASFQNKKSNYLTHYTYAQALYHGIKQFVTQNKEQAMKSYLNAINLGLKGDKLKTAIAHMNLYIEENTQNIPLICNIHQYMVQYYTEQNNPTRACKHAHALLSNEHGIAALLGKNGCLQTLKKKFHATHKLDILLLTTASKFLAIKNNLYTLLPQNPEPHLFYLLQENAKTILTTQAAIPVLKKLAVLTGNMCSYMGKKWREKNREYASLALAAGAELENSDCEFEHGYEMLTTQIESEHRRKALVLISKAAQKNHVQALLTLAEYNQKGVPIIDLIYSDLAYTLFIPNYTRAYNILDYCVTKLHLKEAEPLREKLTQPINCDVENVPTIELIDSGELCYAYGMLLVDNEKKQESLPWFNRAADKGVIEALFYKGIIEANANNIESSVTLLDKFLKNTDSCKETYKKDLILHALRALCYCAKEHKNIAATIASMHHITMRVKYTEQLLWRKVLSSLSNLLYEMIMKNEHTNETDDYLKNHLFDLVMVADKHKDFILLDRLGHIYTYFLKNSDIFDTQQALEAQFCLEKITEYQTQFPKKTHRLIDLALHYDTILNSRFSQPSMSKKTLKYLEHLEHKALLTPSMKGLKGICISLLDSNDIRYTQKDALLLLNEYLQKSHYPSVEAIAAKTRALESLYKQDPVYYVQIYSDWLQESNKLYKTLLNKDPLITADSIGTLKEQPNKVHPSLTNNSIYCASIVVDNKELTAEGSSPGEAEYNLVTKTTEFNLLTKEQITELLQKSMKQNYLPAFILAPTLCLSDPSPENLFKATAYLKKALVEYVKENTSSQYRYKIDVLLGHLYHGLQEAIRICDPNEKTGIHHPKIISNALKKILKEKKILLEYYESDKNMYYVKIKFNTKTRPYEHLLLLDDLRKSLNF